MEVGYASEEFKSAFETRENTTKYNLIHGFQQRLEGDTPSEYIGNSSSSIRFLDRLRIRISGSFSCIPRHLSKRSEPGDFLQNAVDFIERILLKRDIHRFYIFLDLLRMAGPDQG